MQPTEAQFHSRVIVGSPHTHSLTEELAHRHQMVAHHTHPKVTHCDELILIHDSEDLTPLIEVIHRIKHQQRRIISIDCLPSTTLHAHPNTLGFRVDSSPLDTMCTQIDHVLNASKSQEHQLPDGIFVSHAVADEVMINPSIRRLRTQYNSQPFVCADSISAGQNWNQEIEGALRQSNVVLAFCSNDYLKSSYSAYEIGFAHALNTPVRPILLDGSPPPAFVQHLNAPSVPRILRNNPWYSTTDAMMVAIFRALDDLLQPRH